MKPARLCPLLLTALLQIMPLARVVMTDQLPAAPGASVLLKWAVGAFALLGFHAVAGATNVIVSPSTATGTNGVSFLYRILMSEPWGTTFTSSPLPPGLSLNASNGRISGVPLGFIGATNVLLTANDPTGQYAPTSANLELTILASLPVFTQQPASQTNFVGGSVMFATTASTGSSYVWRYAPPGDTNLTYLVTETNSSLVLTNLTTSHAGTYRVLAYNGTGDTNSQPATLTVLPRPALQSLGVQGQSALMSAPVVPNLAYTIEFATHAAGPWQLLTNLPPVATPTNLTFPDSVTTDAARFYRLRSP